MLKRVSASIQLMILNAILILSSTNWKAANPFHQSSFIVLSFSALANFNCNGGGDRRSGYLLDWNANVNSLVFTANVSALMVVGSLSCVPLLHGGLCSVLNAKWPHTLSLSFILDYSRLATWHLTVGAALLSVSLGLPVCVCLFVWAAIISQIGRWRRWRWRHTNRDWQEARRWLEPRVPLASHRIAPSPFVALASAQAPGGRTFTAVFTKKSEPLFGGGFGGGRCHKTQTEWHHLRFRLFGRRLVSCVTTSILARKRGILWPSEADEYRV